MNADVLARIRLVLAGSYPLDSIAAELEVLRREGLPDPRTARYYEDAQKALASPPPPTVKLAAGSLFEHASLGLAKIASGWVFAE